MKRDLLLCQKKHTQHTCIKRDPISCQKKPPSSVKRDLLLSKETYYSYMYKRDLILCQKKPPAVRFQESGTCNHNCTHVPVRRRSPCNPRCLLADAFCVKKKQKKNKSPCNPLRKSPYNKTKTKMVNKNDDVYWQMHSAYMRERERERERDRER
jgi:hypothetical protein